MVNIHNSSIKVKASPFISRINSGAFWLGESCNLTQDFLELIPEQLSANLLPCLLLQQAYAGR